MSAQVQPASQPYGLPSQLLEEANAISRNFIPEERADLLLELSQFAVALDPPRANSWSLELFQIATNELAPGPYRAAMQKNALTTLARTDPMRAAELYTLQNPPARSGDSLPGEDVRSFGARTLFPLLWAKQAEAALPKIEEIAVWLGSTGQYPYGAMTEIVLKVAETDPQKAAALFAQAVSFFPRDPGIGNTNRRYIGFLLRTWEVPGGGLLRQAIQEGLRALERDADTRTTSLYAEVTTAQGSIRFESEAELLAYRLLPLIEQLDPDWAERVREDYPALRGAPPITLGARLNIAAALALQPGDRNPTAMGKALDEHRLMQITQMAERDPKAALETAFSIRDPDRRAIALARTLPAYATADKEQAEARLRQSARYLDSMEPGREKLRLLVALARGYFALERVKDANQATARALDLGEELFAQDLQANPGTMAYAASGSEEMTTLVQWAAKNSADPLTILSRIRQVRSELLRARLLVFFAQGLAEKESEPSPVG
ncbi:MAG: hypothetical protein ACE5IP_04200 [Terriglobia bacterium]